MACNLKPVFSLETVNNVVMVMEPLLVVMSTSSLPMLSCHTEQLVRCGLPLIAVAVFCITHYILVHCSSPNGRTVIGDIVVNNSMSLHLPCRAECVS